MDMDTVANLIQGALQDAPDMAAEDLVDYVCGHMVTTEDRAWYATNRDKIIRCAKGYTGE